MTKLSYILGLSFLSLVFEKFEKSYHPTRGGGHGGRGGLSEGQMAERLEVCRKTQLASKPAHLRYLRTIKTTSLIIMLCRP